MKASELRIGNWVNHQEHKCVRVTDIDSKNIGYDWHDGDRSGWYDIDDFKPIQLTEEWLVKFGFEKKYQTFEFKGLNIDGTVVHFSFDKWCSEYDIENCDFIEIPAECKYVHQLQNLYFALTNEEL
jgi:hypothetical protein